MKAKKERRKKRKAHSAAPGTTAGDRRASTVHEPESDPEEPQGSSEESDADENAVDAAQHTEMEEVRKPKVKEKAEGDAKGQRKGKEDAERPRKRRKLDTEEDHTDHVGDDNAPSRSSPPQARPRSPTPPAALPAFPLPTRPDAPSKQTLALQGLDKALIEAELVDPAKLQPFPTESGDDGGTGLSERTRRRLQELGVTELFAGPYGVSQCVYPSHALTATNSTDRCHTVSSHPQLRQVTILAI